MKASAEISPLSFAQLDGCAEFLAAAFSDEPRNQPWTAEAARERLKEILDTPNSLGLVSLRENGEVLGFVLGFARRRPTARRLSSPSSA